VIPRAVRRPAARRDFIKHFVYLAENAGLEVAHRFRFSVERSYQDLAKMPHVGVLRTSVATRHQGIRLFRVHGFENYWIAYQPHKVGVAIERLFHAKEDYTRIMQ
jgi:toxin ParE1/3/4